MYDNRKSRYVRENSYANLVCTIRFPKHNHLPKLTPRDVLTTTFAMLLKVNRNFSMLGSLEGKMREEYIHEKCQKVTMTTGQNIV
jgi:hypothetical protein